MTVALRTALPPGVTTFTVSPPSRSSFTNSGESSSVAWAMSLLLNVYSKPVSFDRHGVSIGWFWGAKTHYDWDQVLELRNLPFVPGVAVLRFDDRKCWPIFMDLDRARHLNDAILIWKSAA